MKKLLFIFFALSVIVQGQVGYVPSGRPVYQFLDRMDSQSFLANYDQYETPKTRKEIASNLIEILKLKNLLSAVDRARLSDFIQEFYFDIYKSDAKYSSFFSGLNFEHFISDKEKYLYFYGDSSEANIFVNFDFTTNQLFKNNLITDQSQSATIFQFGGSVEGSFKNMFGFSVRATNGTFLGDRELATSFRGLRYNYKINREQDGIGDDYFDETTAYFSADFDYVKFKIARDRVNLGYGTIKTILGNNPPVMDYIALNLKYKIFSFSFYHGKLLGSTKILNLGDAGSVNFVTEKYFVYHRVYLNLSKHFTLGMGETVIYSNRSIDLSYLNPFSFYKSVEHANQDRDNSALFIDFTNNSIKGLKFYGTFFIDDIDFGKIGTGWYGNKTMLNLGALSSLFYPYLPVDLEVQYIMIQPYVYSHRINENNFTNLGYPFVSPIEPNSSNIFIDLNWFFNSRLNLKTSFFFSIHGENITDGEGEVIKNVGGDLTFGHRVGDSETVEFLDGTREYRRAYSMTLIYQPLKNYFISVGFDLINNSLANEIHEKYIQSGFNISLKF
ncbi:MAG: hypothetical protein GXO87_15030 [Chlorobi bacterium]|nr:hypothetical protein [Chlorobiota bacterium]